MTNCLLNRLGSALLQLYQQLQNLSQHSLRNRLMDILIQLNQDCSTKFQSAVKEVDDKENQFIFMEEDIFNLGHGQISQFIPLTEIGKAQIMSNLEEPKSKGGRKPADPEMEWYLSEWLLQQLDSGNSLTSRAVIDRSKQLSTVSNFKFSKGWFCRFKNRLVRSLQRQGHLGLAEQVRRI